MKMWYTAARRIDNPNARSSNGRTRDFGSPVVKYPLLPFCTTFFPLTAPAESALNKLGFYVVAYPR